MSESDSPSIVADVEAEPVGVHDGRSEAALAAARATPERIVAAWANHDAATFADAFTPDGYMILPGVYASGRDEIRFFMASAFAVPYYGTRVAGTPLEARLLAPGVAVVVTKGGVLAPGDSEVSAERAIRATWVVVERDGRWQIAAYQNSPAGNA
ncbi:SgcJ/EcaC family oxidoreductase [Amycolatopsis anabasis]|uniref:SgcJ/EcaC family oxidoreductase n=1 Tax=Amycolatopsis anabasis TaxID=1840409 RepID=UPI00131AA02B|nr:SgcJ/EcaC family oxidoreductase [Amycolatopsis anabasis]